MDNPNNELVIAFLFGSLMLALVGAFMFVMVIFYQKRKIRNIREQQRLITLYERSVLKAKVEMREETLKYVGQELHDNVGQVLSLIKLYLSRPDTHHKAVVKQLIEQAIVDIRSLSHDLNISRVEQYSLADFIEQELSKVHKAGTVKTAFDHDENYCEPNDVQNRLMISRVFQECINNILKHAEATRISVKLMAEDDWCSLDISDDGVGFDTQAPKRGSGLANIYDRVKLMGGDVRIDSAPGDGTRVSLRIPQN